VPPDEPPAKPGPATRFTYCRKAQEVGNDSAMAMELPFTFAGAVLLGGGLGYLLDR